MTLPSRRRHQLVRPHRRTNGSDRSKKEIRSIKSMQSKPESCKDTNSNGDTKY
ncbi:hypothetical protein [Nostoc sp.]|uniref:hypothetical protein n=1 Tax=Nostoc sp. TaxID=1180 RepID=UPI002FFAF1F0